ncbi:hypothetical protein M407DRAFT_3584 [Tulasnella calospora MUT 4182]|uniref:Uncharacterized protein n=1 Tax=Tulasnella calospora MUT 4182 TaxID=1051891 RepID=A0A0C3QY52_9AGAM|nr:hypothetical protein M407DRAFT_3584 [Tulasnella calospora MUT 4182]
MPQFEVAQPTRRQLPVGTDVLGAPRDYLVYVMIRALRKDGRSRGVRCRVCFKFQARGGRGKVEGGPESASSLPKALEEGGFVEVGPKVVTGSNDAPSGQCVDSGGKAGVTLRFSAHALRLDRSASHWVTNLSDWNQARSQIFI